MKFIKCFTVEDSKKLESTGLKKMFEQNGTYWFILDDSVNFSNCQVDYEITDRVNL